MAVEIPVVIDIEGAFQDAAKKINANMHQIQKAIESNNINLFPQLEKNIKELDRAKDTVERIMRELKGFTTRKEANMFAWSEADISQLQRMVDSLTKAQITLNQSSGFERYITDLSQANIQLLQMSEYYKILERESLRLSDSVNGYRQRLTEMNERWNSMTEAERRSAEGTALYEKYKREQAAMRETVLTMDEKIAREEKDAAIAKKAVEERIAAAKKEQEQINARRKARMDESATLKKTARSINDLQQQEAILQARMNRSALGSKNYEKYRDQLEAVRKKLMEVRGGVDGVTNAMKRQSVVMSNLKSMASMYISVFGALRFVKQIRDVTGELEFQRISLGRLIQDVERGNYLFERIKEQAIESPFRIKDLVTYTKQLAAYRVEQEELFHTTKRLADISAGLGVDMNRLILAYGQVRAASVLRGQELRQFTEAGIPLVQLLAEKFTDLNGEMMTTGEVFKKISDRAVPFSMIADIFEDLTEKGGMFYQMQEEQAKTLKGRWEKLKDAYDVALQSLGDTETFQRQNDIVIGALRFIADNLRVMTKLVDAAILSWASYNAVLWLAGARTKAVATAEQEALIAESLRTKKVSGLFVKIKAQAWAEAELAAATRTATIGTNALSRALAKLKIALLTNPYAFAAAAIIGIVLALARYKKAVDDSAEATHTLNRAVDDMRAFNKRHDRVQKLIDQYETLATLEERNAAQNETLARTTKKLAAEFPQLSENLNNNNLSLQERLEIVKELNKEEAKRLEDEIADKTRTLEVNRTKLTYAKEDQVTAENAKKEAEAYYLALKKELDNLGEKEGRGAFMKFMFGGNEYDEIYRQLARQRKILDEAEEKANKAGDSVRSLEEAIDSLEQEIGNSNKTTQEADETWEEWKKQIYELQKGMLKVGDSPLFGKDDISGFESVYDLSKKLKKEMDDLTVSIAAMKTMFASMEEGDAKDSMGKDIKKLETKLEVAKAIKEALNLTWKSSGSGRDSRLSDLKKDISEITNAYKKFAELRKYMSEGKAISEIGTLFPQLAGWEPTYANTIQRLEKMRADVAKKLAASPKDKTLLEMQRAIDTEISNLKFDNLKKKTEDELKRVSRELKRSEAARDFYNNILGITGDADIAASMSVSVYGGLGNDFKENLQKELNAALESLDAASRTDALNKAFAERDFDTILKNMDKFPEEWQKRLKEMAAEDQKFNAELAKNLLQTLERAKSYGQKRVEISQQTARRMQQIEDLNADEAIKAELRKQNAKKEAEDIAKLQYEAFKETPMYVELFSNLDRASTAMLRNMRDNIVKMKAQWTDLAPTEMKELQSRIAELDRQLATKNPFRELIAGIREYRALMQEQTRGEADTKAVRASEVANAQKQALEMADKMYNATVKKYGVDSMEAKAAKKNLDIQKDKTDKAIEEEKAAQNTANSYRLAAKHISDAAEAMQEWAGYVSTSLGGIEEIVGTFASDDFAETFNIISGGINKTLSGTATLLAGMSQGVLGIPQMIAGLGQIIGGIFGSVQQLKIKSANKEIDKQTKLISDLEYQYSRLENAIAKAFGSDYVTNYNQQLENLAAQQEAYLKQAEAERSKGKKADEEKIKEYENSARDAADKILDMQSQLSEFFSGTDITSAAKDFADSWLEAYKEFGSTTIAMRQKFQEMVEEMVQKSLAAKVMQELLTPIFNEIDRLAQEGGELSAQDIAAIAQMADQQIPAINDAMLTLMNTLSQAGYNLRQQPGQFTGIARNIANASEESITGLAAGINAQNYYLSYVPTLSANVAAILTAITGGTAAVEGTAPVTPTDGELMMSYLSTLPTMNENLAAILFALKSVISPNNVATNTHYIAVRN